MVQPPEFNTYIKIQNISEHKLVYYPYYTEDFNKVVDKKEKYNKLFPKGINILFTGNIGVAKSFETIVSAFELIKEFNSSWKKQI